MRGQGVALRRGLVDPRVADGRRGDGDAEDVAPDHPGPDRLASGQAGNDGARRPPDRRRTRPRDRELSAAPCCRLCGSSLVAVLGEEQLLQRRLAAHQPGDARARPGPSATARPTRAPGSGPTRPSVSTELTPGTPDRSGTAPSNVASTVSALRCRISASVPISTSFPVAQDAHPVAERLHLAHDVRGQKDRLAPVARLADAVAKRLLHQRVEPAGRLVEDEQVGRAPSARRSG